MTYIRPEHWYAALASQCGIVIQTDNPARDMARLYELHRDLADPDLDDIRIVARPGELWLYKQSMAPTVSGRHYRTPTDDDSCD
ncbi:MAG TPA: hypothetical protein VN203_16660 [Candidatus Acidoferrum sp.]|nr:hypothetical protein [Candidatus Acidoferrum sp.]